MSSGSQNIGKWSNPIAGVGPRRSQATYTVPDDWEAETNEEEREAKQIWEEADAKAPMPQIVIAGGRPSAPPPTAFAPSMQILKRPQNASPKPTTPTAPQKSLAEREAEYKAARERIFAANSGTPSVPSTTGTMPNATGSLVTAPKTQGSAGADKAPSAKGKTEKTDKQLDTVVRQPRGPTSNSGRGFGNRRLPGGSRGGAPGGSGAQSPSSQASSPGTQTPAPSGHPQKRP